MSVVKVNFAQTLKQAQEQARIKAAAAQKPRITAHELEALTLITNQVNSVFVRLIQENPESKSWAITLETPLHFDERLVKGLELISKEYPEVSFTVLNPHTLGFRLERSAIELVEQGKESQEAEAQRDTSLASLEQMLLALLTQG